MSDTEAVVSMQKGEAKRAEDLKKSFLVAQEWVEQNVPQAERCEPCNGVGLEELEAGGYANCKACSGTGKK